MDSADMKSSKKRRQNEDPEAAAKRKQKKQKKALSAETAPADASDIEHVNNAKPKRSKKDKVSKAAAAGISASQQSILDPVEISLTPPPTGTQEKPKKSKKKRDVEVEPSTNGADHDEEEPNGSLTASKKEKKDKKKKGKHEDGDSADTEHKKLRKERKDRKKKKNRDADVGPTQAARAASVDLGFQSTSQNGGNESMSPPPATPEKMRRRKDKSLEIQATPPPESPKNGATSTVRRFSTPLSQADSHGRASTDFKTYNSADLDPEPRGPPPVISQQVSRWVPLWPRGWDQPITAAIEQHLTPKLHRYDSEVGGVLLSFKNVCLNDQPTREGAATADNEAVKLLSVNEYGVGYCWLIAELELFVPKRGSWLEGELILQNQGHVGVVCWGKFNASIEASRLPPKWYWVAAPEEDSDVNMEFDADGEEHHSATILGHWVDERGNRIHGNLHFRINNYDVGLSGDHSFLCIEGTMLSEKEENRLRERELKRINPGSTGGSLRRRQRELPAFGMTDLGLDADAKQKPNWGSQKSKRERSEQPSEAVENVDLDDAVEE
ncbi:hypothetical protein jhhlp_007642 [Lomentospora prolificans]|uniref:DNA-directed RNA polymerase subunit n=1 Tax=Lomentospora prolificans TaxID=41688 RepID=A0A2N3N057_9PEZI|nr:hypothetical protein jhhlp_007642 [Lomentospora prolificans]